MRTQHPTKKEVVTIETERRGPVTLLTGSNADNGATAGSRCANLNNSASETNCDDIVMLAPAKGAAHDLRDDLAIELHLLGLDMRRDWRVFASVDGIDFAGYVHRQSHTLLRKSIKKRMAKRLSPKRSDTRRSATAYNGWVRHGNTRNLRHAIVSPRLTLEEAQ